MSRSHRAFVALVLALIVVAAGSVILRTPRGAAKPVPRYNSVTTVAGKNQEAERIAPRDYPLRPDPVVTTTTAPAPPVTIRPASRSVPTVPAQPSRTAATPPPAGGSVWDLVAQCETGGDWSMHGPIYSGGLGFATATWRAYGVGPSAGDATRAEQIVVAERIMPGGPRWPGRANGTCSGYHGW